jgi:hypothetical protein
MLLLFTCSVLLLAISNLFAAGFDTKLLRAAAIGYAVKQTGPALNSFVNTLTFQGKVPAGISTKVVPILSVGEKGYVGAAQVAGPSPYVKSVQAVWLYEDNFSNNEFRLKVLVPSASLNPLAFKKVQKVGVAAIIDVSLDGRWKGQTFSRSVKFGDVLKAGVVAVAINAAAKPLNDAINIIAKGSADNTKVVPIATIGDKAYIGGVQISGPVAGVKATKVAYQYEDIFDGGKFRIKAFVPSKSSSPFDIRRVSGVGITALIDTSLADQQRIRERAPFWQTYQPKYSPIGGILSERFRGDVVQPGHDQGLHKGWYIGKGNQRKMLTGVWADRYQRLSSKDKEAFVVWWNDHHNDSPGGLEAKWQKWLADRGRNSGKPSSGGSQEHKGKGKGKGH